MLYADDILLYLFDTEHSLPEEKTILLHSYNTVSSYKLNLIRSNCLSLINKVPKYFFPYISRELSWASILDFF